ncbi:hypothetical protein VKS41_003565 [Umbelopsis sp. WA50703]
MIPRLPPLLLIALGGATVYGIQNVLSKLEQRALEAPGAKPRIPFRIEHARALRIARTGVIGATLAYTGYWVYDRRHNRPTPASQAYGEQKAFHEDQYADRERAQRQYVDEMRLKQRLSEEERRAQLRGEVEMMGRSSR